MANITNMMGFHTQEQEWFSWETQNVGVNVRWQSAQHRPTCILMTSACTGNASACQFSPVNIHHMLKLQSFLGCERVLRDDLGISAIKWFGCIISPKTICAAYPRQQRLNRRGFPNLPPLGRYYTRQTYPGNFCELTLMGLHQRGPK